MVPLQKGMPLPLMVRYPILGEIHIILRWNISFEFYINIATPKKILVKWTFSIFLILFFFLGGLLYVYYIYITCNIYIYITCTYITGWWFQSLWTILVSWDYYAQYGKKHVPHHQPVYIYMYRYQRMSDRSITLWDFSQNSLWIAITNVFHAVNTMTS